MTTRSIRMNCALALIVIAIISIGPVPITSTLGAFVALFRPRWFKRLVDNIYNNRQHKSNSFEEPETQTDCTEDAVRAPVHRNDSSLAARVQLLLPMLAFMLLDIGPIPTTSLIALFIVIFRPRWFLTLMRRIYGD